MTEPSNGRVHWSFWVIGALALVFNLLGCMNYISQMNADMVADMPEVYRAIVESRPAWATAAFAIAVFGGVLGAILLLLRKPVAVYVFIASLIGAAVAQLPLLGMSGLPAPALIGGLVQVVFTLFLIWYAKRAKQKNWIR
jgi:uncharacterized membrane protein